MKAIHPTHAAPSPLFNVAIYMRVGSARQLPLFIRDDAHSRWVIDRGVVERIREQIERERCYEVEMQSGRENITRRRCLIYARSDSLAGGAAALDEQERKCRLLIATKAHEGWVHKRTIKEAGVSGQEAPSRGLREAIREIAGGSVEVIVVYSRDLLARTETDSRTITALIQELGGGIAYYT